MDGSSLERDITKASDFTIDEMGVKYINMISIVATLLAETLLMSRAFNFEEFCWKYCNSYSIRVNYRT